MIRWVWIYGILIKHNNQESFKMAAGSSTSKFKVISVDGDFQRELTLANDKLVVVDFFATW